MDRSHGDVGQSGVDAEAWWVGGVPMRWRGVLKVAQIWRCAHASWMSKTFYISLLGRV
jgi:hypothetical protein